MSEDEFKSSNPIDYVCSFKLLKEMLEESLHSTLTAKDKFSRLNMQTITNTAKEIRDSLNEFLKKVETPETQNSRRNKAVFKCLGIDDPFISFFEKNNLLDLSWREIAGITINPFSLSGLSTLLGTEEMLNSLGRIINIDFNTDDSVNSIIFHSVISFFYYHPNGQLKKTKNTDSRGLFQTCIFDSEGRLVKQLDRDGEVTQEYSYDIGGLQTKTTAEGGSLFSVDYETFQDSETLKTIRIADRVVFSVPNKS